MEALLEPGLQAFACGDEQAAAAGWSKCLGPRVCETGRVYLLRDRAQVGPHSHPGRVLLRVRWQGLVFFCRSTAGSPDRPGANRERSGHRSASRAGPIRTRGGCSYGFGAGCGFVVGAPPPVRTANEAGTYLRPGRPPFAHGAGAPTGSQAVLVFAVGAPPDRRTAPVRTANEAGTDWRLGQAPFAPGAGAPTGSRAVLVFAV